jgi:hypothetical protein
VQSQILIHVFLKSQKIPVICYSLSTSYYRYRIIKRDNYESGTKDYLPHSLGSHVRYRYGIVLCIYFNTDPEMLRFETTKMKILRIDPDPVYCCGINLNDFFHAYKPVPSIIGYLLYGHSSDPVIYD